MPNVLACSNFHLSHPPLSLLHSLDPSSLLLLTALPCPKMQSPVNMAFSSLMSIAMWSSVCPGVAITFSVAPSVFIMSPSARKVTRSAKRLRLDRSAWGLSLELGWGVLLDDNGSLYTGRVESVGEGGDYQCIYSALNIIAVMYISSLSHAHTCKQVQKILLARLAKRHLDQR